MLEAYARALLSWFPKTNSWKDGEKKKKKTGPPILLEASSSYWQNKPRTIAWLDGLGKKTWKFPNFYDSCDKCAKMDGPLTALSYLLTSWIISFGRCQPAE